MKFFLKTFTVLGIMILLGAGCSGAQPPSPISSVNVTTDNETTDPIMPTTIKEFCSIKNEISSTKDWIHACYLNDLLTATCKHLFDINGYYIGKHPAQYMDLGKYLEDAKDCKCLLPTTLAKQLNDANSFGNSLCDKDGYYKPEYKNLGN